ncbi:MAG: hypothetical protein ACRDKT_05660 [Actinomycetota bacterium]
MRSLRAVMIGVLSGALVGAALVPAHADPPTVEEEPAPRFLVGAAARDITPEGVVNQGGFGLGDGSVFPDEVVGRGNQARAETERLYARAFVVDNGTEVLAFVITDNIGMFAKYQDGPGLIDIAESVAAAPETEGRIPVPHVVAAGSHTHSGPDTLGAWGGVDRAYLQLIHDQAVGAVLDAYASRRPAELTVGVADGRQTFQGSSGVYDLIDNQVCLETASNSFEGSTNSCVPRQESVDSDVRVLQAREVLPPSNATQHSANGCEGPGDHDGRTCERLGDVIGTFVTYAAHPTLGGAGGLHGDWIAYLDDALETTYGGVGVVWPGTIGRVQPERGWNNRRVDFTTNLMTMIGQALDGGRGLTDNTLAMEKALVRTEVTNPILAGLLLEGDEVGAPLMRSQESPWLVGSTVQTVVGAGRIGDVALLGVPGEAYAQIALGAADSIQGERTVFTLGLADDMLGYLISHTEDYAAIAAITPVNDNALFNVSPRIGDHVMCAGIRMAAAAGWQTELNPRCVAFDAEDGVTGRRL